MGLFEGGIQTHTMDAVRQWLLLDATNPNLDWDLTTDLLVTFLENKEANRLQYEKFKVLILNDFLTFQITNFHFFK